MGLGSRCAVALQKIGRPYQVTDDSSSNNRDVNFKPTYFKRNTTNKNDVLSQLQNYISKLITILILYKTQVPSHPNQAFGFGHEGSGFQVSGRVFSALGLSPKATTDCASTMLCLARDDAFLA